MNTGLSSRQILSETDSRQVDQIRSGERCCCINAINNYVPPVFIFPRANFKAEMFFGAPQGSLGLANPSGWVKSGCFPALLCHFISCISASIDNPAVLVLDDHSSHISLEVVDIARNYSIFHLHYPLTAGNSCNH